MSCPELLKAMWNIKQEILNGAKTAGVQASELACADCERIRASILTRFAVKAIQWPAWIWEHFTSGTLYADRDGWRWIGDYRYGKDVIMLFPEHDEKTMFRFASGQSIAGVLAGCFGFEFYLTNDPVDFVLLQPSRLRDCHR